MNITTFKRIPHAAHYGYAHPAKGHDLEQWDVTSEARPEVARVGSGVPSDAAYLCGYLDKDGRQHWLFVRRAPLSAGPCARCGGEQ